MKLMILLLLALSSAAAHDFYTQHQDGWFWYHDKLVKPNQAMQLSVITPEQQVDLDKEALDVATKTAYQNPTEANIINYIRKSDKVLDKSYHFALKLRQVRLQHPDLIKRQVHPTNQIAKELYVTEENQVMAQKITKLAKEYGLFYIFSSQCKYCHAFAPTVKRFAEKYQWQVLAIAADGGSLAEFPDAKPDNGIIRKLKITAYPALVAVNPYSKKILPLAMGMVSEEEIISRISILTRAELN